MEHIHFKDIRRVVIGVCSRHSEIAAAYIFGSAATGNVRPGSDIDVAVLLDPARSGSFPLLSFMSNLDRSLGCRVDVTVLNRAGEVLKYEVRRTGKLVYNKNPGFRKRFEIMGRKTFEDFLYLHKRYVSKVIYGVNNG